MKNVIFLLSSFLIFIASCSTPVPSAQEVVDKAIAVSETSILQNSKANFTFRGIDYDYERNNGTFTYTRTQKDSIGNEVKDVLNNKGLIRYINNEEVKIQKEKRALYSASINSVIYFAFLPLWLNDAAVIKSYEGTIKIKDTNYHKIKVTFKQEGGGEDFEDVFYYWFDTADYSMDYLAYSYNEDDGVGMRFRVAYNQREVNGVMMQDYKNLKSKVKDKFELGQLDQAYMDDEMEELSLIELVNMTITPL